MPKPLKANSEKIESPAFGSSNLLFRTVKPALVAGFALDKYIGDAMTATKQIKYRDIKLNTTGHKWYVEFKYLIPGELRPNYKNRKWLRVKIYKGINVVRTTEYAEAVKRAVTEWLKDGYSPFEADIEAMKVGDLEPSKKKWNIQQAVLFFKQKWKGRGLSPKSTAKYDRAADRFLSWLTARDLQHHDAKEITSEHIERYLYDSKETLKWSNTTFNGERGFIGTIFTFLSKKNIANKVEHTGKLKAKAKKHRYFDQRTFEKLKKILLEHDPYLYFACQCVYYMAIRSEDELKYLKVGNIHPDRKQVLIAEGKTGERLIPLVDEMIKIFKARKVLKADPSYYVFSVPSKTKFVPDGKPGAEPFGTGFFSKRFAKIREKAGLSSDHTLYGMKHTRIIHLKNDGAQDADIMQLTGHSSYESYSKYMRDLGLTANTALLSKKTRKI